MSYPADHWALAASARWLSLTDELGEWHPPDSSQLFDNPQRKWEIVSAYQKSVRRGLHDWAQRLAGTVLAFGPEQWRYFWTRIATTACEDLGAGDPELMRFVIACAALFPPSAGEQVTRHVWSFLTARMCEAQRSRIFCQLSLLEDWTERERVPAPQPLTDWEAALLSEIHQLSKKADPFWTTTPLRAWHQRSNWRGENMLKVAVYTTPLVAVPFPGDLPPFEVLLQLPDFCYDMHTRVGKRTCVRTCHVAAVNRFWGQHPTERRAEAIGWALFLLEGGLIRHGLVDQRLSLLEHKYLASRWGWPLSTWEAFLRLVACLLRDGIINHIRREVLREQPYNATLFDERNPSK